MNAAEFKNVYWKYYLILEKDVLNVEPYISFHPDNYRCFSTEFIKLYQVICSEIDVICKEYCKYIDDMGNFKNIKDYTECILTHCPEIVRQNVYMSEQSECVLTPWKEWSFDTNNNDSKNSKIIITPEWWKKYNDIKHKRSDLDTNGKYNYQYASLNNVLNALAALYVLEKYFYADLAKDDTPNGKSPNIVIEPLSKIFGLFDNDLRFLTIANIGI